MRDLPGGQRGDERLGRGLVYVVERGLHVLDWIRRDWCTTTAYLVHGIPIDER
jgi:hypothetical protein